MTKVEMAKDIYFQIRKYFDIRTGKLFDIQTRQIQSKLLYGLVTYGLLCL